MQPLESSAKISRGYEEWTISKPDSTRLNGAIRAPELRVIDAEGKMIGVMTREEALAQARLVGLDLVEVSPLANPPVAKVVDWGKYSYQKIKQDKKNRLKNKTDLKQIRLGLKIGQHDLDIKLRQTRDFLAQGHSVKFTVRFRGRELAHTELGYELLKRVAQLLADVAVVDQEPKMFGKQLNMSMRNSNAKAKDA